MKQSPAKLLMAAFFVAACAVSTSAFAQSDDKHALAVRLARIQQKTDGAAMTEQLVGGAVQPLLAGWSQRLDEAVPPARQKEVRDKLDVELKKFTDATQKAIEGQTAKSAEAALVPIFMNKLTEDEMRTVIAWLESPVSAKFQSLGPEATNAWAQSIIDATKTTVENSAKNFNAAAERAVNAAASAPPPARK